MSTEISSKIIIVAGFNETFSVNPNYEFNYLYDSLNLIISQLDSTLALQLDTIENQANNIINLAEEIDFNIDSIYTLNQIIDGLDQELALKVDTINFLMEPIEIRLFVGWNMIG